MLTVIPSAAKSGATTAIGLPLPSVANASAAKYTAVFQLINHINRQLTARELIPWLTAQVG